MFLPFPLPGILAGYSLVSAVRQINRILDLNGEYLSGSLGVSIAFSGGLGVSGGENSHRCDLETDRCLDLGLGWMVWARLTWHHYRSLNVRGRPRAPNSLAGPSRAETQGAGCKERRGNISGHM
jgi:hypothetical protein